MSKHPIRVPAGVYQTLEAIRRSGVTNMLDRPRVIECAELLGDEETAAWLRAHPQTYAVGIFVGLAPDDTTEGGQ